MKLWPLADNVFEKKICRRRQVLAVLDIIYLTACVYKPCKALRDVISPTRLTAGQTTAVRHRISFAHVMLYVELAARGLASVSQTAIVWVVVMVTIDRYLAVCRPLVGVGLRTLRCVRRTVVVVVAVAMLYNIPVFFENKADYCSLLVNTIMAHESKACRQILVSCLPTGLLRASI